MSKAFTLIELILVISMVSILAGLAPLSFRILVSALELDTAVKRLVADLHLARQLSSAQHLTVTLDFISDRPLTYQIYTSDGQIIKMITLPGGLSNPQKKAIKFAASGMPAFGGSGTLELKNRQGKSKKIIISSVGRIRIQ
jgi:prepilin-type N-terminal cleavage/methylation domain-containing protein